MADYFLLEKIGSRISARRRALGLTQEQVAERMDVSIQMISNLELGKKAIRPENLVKVCTVLDISADYLLFGHNSWRENAEIAQKIRCLSPEHQHIISLLVDSLLPKGSSS